MRALIWILLLSTLAVAQTPQARLAVPSGTQARLELVTPLNSKMNEVGDEVEARLEHSIVVDGRTVLRKGTIFYGRVTQVSSAGRPQRQGSMTIAFDRVETIYGNLPVQLRLRAIDDYAREEKLRADDEGKVKGGRSGSDTVRNTVTGVGIGGAASLPIAIASRGGGAAVASAATLGGGALAGLMLTRGKDVRLQPGTILRVEFAAPLVIEMNTSDEFDD